MKINWNSKYTTISVYTFVVICLSILFFTGISNIDKLMEKINVLMAVLQPFIIGMVIAYLLNFIVVFFEDKLLNKSIFDSLSLKIKRSISMILSYSVAVVVSILFMNFVLPQLINSMMGLSNDIPLYANNLIEKIEIVCANIDKETEELLSIKDKFYELGDYIVNCFENVIPILGNIIKTTASSVWNVALGIIISIYVLLDKEHFKASSKKTLFAIFSKTQAEKIIDIMNLSKITFDRFISGKILDSFIVAVLTFIILSIFEIPYTLLISVIVGVTNLIPFFGPFFGAIPSFIIILFISPVKAVLFLIIVVIIQQVDCNILEPKILGDSIGISAFWILFSIMVFGKLFGLVGMIIGVPLFAIIYSIVKELIEYRLTKKDLSIDIKDYM